MIKERARKPIALLARRFKEAVLSSVRYSEPNLKAIGALGIIGFPLYYYIWQHLFPQAYENLSLRLVGSLLFVPFFFFDRWPRKLRHWRPVFWCIAVTYGLPFFFTFMLLNNDMSIVWGMSMLAATFLLVMIVHDWLLLIAFYLLGSALGWLAYGVTGDVDITVSAYLQQLPIYLFALVAGGIFNYKQGLFQEERLSGMLAVSRTIAHELRTPLLGIRSGIEGLQRYVPPLMQGYERARAAGLDVMPIRQAHYALLQDVLERIENEASNSSTMIDILLVNAGKPQFDEARAERHSIRACVETALRRYPFKSEADRDKVRVRELPDFQFAGSNVLLMHVLFNLLKNALHFTAKAGRGEIEIWTVPGERSNALHVRDTGTGVKPEDLPRIFDRFYSTVRAGEGAGIGLSFCKMVLEGIGGGISCRSLYGEYTEFVLTLPRIAHAEGA